MIKNSYCLITLILSVSLLNTAKTLAPLNERSSEHTGDLLKKAQKHLAQKNDSNIAKIEQLAEKVFTKLDIKIELSLPVSTDNSPILKREKFSSFRSKF